MNVLFVCEGNMMRSSMGEAFYNVLTESDDARSAGAIATEADHVAPRTVEVMDEIGVSMKGHYSKQLTPEMIDKADVVILFPTDYMPDYALESLKAKHWDVIDPHYHHDKGMQLVRDVRDDIKNRVEQLIKETQ